MILLAIGANLPGPWGNQPIETCRRAAAEVASLPGLRLEAVSPWYRTAPVPASDQPDYVNGCVRLSGHADPAALLASLQAIEQAGGRRRGIRNAARTLDIDIIDIDGLVRHDADPLLPHPRAHERAFVLLPLQDVAPDWVLPDRGWTVAAMLARLRDGCGGGDAPLGWPVQYR